MMFLAANGTRAGIARETCVASSCAGAWNPLPTALPGSRSPFTGADDSFCILVWGSDLVRTSAGGEFINIPVLTSSNLGREEFTCMVQQVAKGIKVDALLCTLNTISSAINDSVCAR
jgi:hypothetical protein